MARKPRDFDGELQALMDKARKVKTQKTTQLGEVVQITGADTLSMEALAGALVALVKQSKDQPALLEGWTEAGKAVFQSGGKRGKAKAAGDAAPGTPGVNGSAPAADGSPE